MDELVRREPGRESASRRGTERASNMRQRPKGRERKLAALLILVLLAAVCGFTYQAVMVRLVQHQHFEVSDASFISTWSVPLPFKYRLTGSRSVPPGPQDGLRLMRPDPPAQ